MKNKLYINFLFILVTSYSILTFVGKLYAPKGEIFPFFHWGLFVTTPQTIEKDFIDIFESYNDLNREPISIYDYLDDKMPLYQSSHIVKRLKNCMDKDCFDDAVQRIIYLLPEKSYSIFYVENEFKEKDTIAIIENGHFIRNTSWTK